MARWFSRLTVWPPAFGLMALAAFLPLYCLPLWLGLGVVGIALRFWQQRREDRRQAWLQAGAGMVALALALGAAVAVRCHVEPRPQGLGIPAALCRELEGRLVDDARMDARGGYLLHVALTRVAGPRGHEGSAAGKLTLRLDPGEAPLYRGARVRAALQKPLQPDSPWPQQARLLESWPPEGTDALRGAILESLTRAPALDPATAPGALFQALALGRQDLLDPAMAEAFRSSGCSHVVALSGTHLSALAGLILLVLLPLSGQRRSLWPTMALALGFVWLAGPYASVLRALAHFLLQGFLRRWSSRLPQDGIFALSAMLVLIVLPSLGAEPGFWLSCGALAGLLWAAGALAEVLKPVFKPFLAESLGAGIAASAGAWPFMLAYALPANPQGILAGILLAPASMVYLVLSLLCCVLFLFLPPAGLFSDFCTSVMGVLYQIILTMARCFVWT